MADPTPIFTPTSSPTINELSSRLFHLSDSLDLVAKYNEESESDISAFLRLMALNAAECAEALSRKKELIDSELSGNFSKLPGTPGKAGGE